MYVLNISIKKKTVSVITIKLENQLLVHVNVACPNTFYLYIQEGKQFEIEFKSINSNVLNLSMNRIYLSHFPYQIEWHAISFIKFHSMSYFDL